MKTDIEISREAQLKPILEIAAKLGLSPEEMIPYGHDKAKISSQAIKKREKEAQGKLILVTAISPTKAGEGKSTTTIGLGDALSRLGKKTLLCLREPSMGPVFGIKGGAAGGGYAQVVPMEDINLHFTGDMHAITAANNLICACIDNHLYWGNELRFDLEKITFKRCMDMNDRCLREVIVSKGIRKDRDVRSDGFNITVASEIMAVLCLAKDEQDLRARLGQMMLGYNVDGDAIYLRDLGIEGALCLILKDAILPNLVQTLENVPALIHGGPFANIAHGCNSVIATKAALNLADYVVTEAGFGADLGAEKFLDIKCRFAGLNPQAVVLVATCRALKMHGGQDFDDLATENIAALEKGFANLDRHMENIRKFGLEAVVCINRFPTDTEAELDCLRRHCAEKAYRVALSEVFTKGSEGGLALAEEVLHLLDERKTAAPYQPIYQLEDSFEEKLEKIVTKIYGASTFELTDEAKADLERLRHLGVDHLPLCMAKTPNSFTDDPKVLGAPDGFKITVREIRPSLGAGFLVCLTGQVMTMPGLPKRPMAMDMDIRDGVITGLS